MIQTLTYSHNFSLDLKYLLVMATALANYFKHFAKNKIKEKFLP